MVKTKFGLLVAYAYEFGIPSGQAAVTRSGNELFIKFNLSYFTNKFDHKKFEKYSFIYNSFFSCK